MGLVYNVLASQGRSMSYWWVNHKQTYSSEVEGGYIWSPKENSNGARNQTYINLTLTTPGDVVFSYAAGKIKAIGIVESNCSEYNVKYKLVHTPNTLWLIIYLTGL